MNAKRTRKSTRNTLYAVRKFLEMRVGSMGKCGVPLRVPDFQNGEVALELHGLSPLRCAKDKL